MSTYDVEETGMTERQALLDFPGAEALQAAGRVEPPSAQALARALAAVEAAAREDAVVTPFPRRRRVVAILAAAAVAAGVLAYVNTGAAPADARRASQAASASVFLNDVAEVADTRPAGSGKYWKTHFPFGDEYVSRSMHDYFVIKGQTSTKGRRPNWDLGPKSLDWNGLDRLTTDPAQLLKLMQSSTESADQNAFQQASYLLGGAPASPKLRAGLFQALAQIKGVKLGGTVKDSVGRSGTELVFNGATFSDRMIIDPKTSVLLESVETWVKGANVGKAAHRTYLSVGLTDKIG
ncbi:hypothetical protein ACFXJ5_39090 [Streptomyces sp. NPDC059373]